MILFLNTSSTFAWKQREKKILQSLQNCLFELDSTMCVGVRSIQVRTDMIFKKTSSLQGIVRPPIGWWYPYSSSALLSKSWNEGWFKHPIGITNLFFFSPTYTARYPFGTSAPFETSCLALLTPSKPKPMFSTSCLLYEVFQVRSFMIYLRVERGGIYMALVWITLLPKLNGLRLFGSGEKQGIMNHVVLSYTSLSEMKIFMEVWSIKLLLEVERELYTKKT